MMFYYARYNEVSNRMLPCVSLTSCYRVSPVSNVITGFFILSAYMKTKNLYTKVVQNIPLSRYRRGSIWRKSGNRIENSILLSEPQHIMYIITSYINYLSQYNREVA